MKEKRMKALLLVLSVFMTVSQVYAICLTPEQASNLGCVRYEKGDKWCANNYGKKYKAYVTDEYKCSKKEMRKIVGDTGLGPLNNVRAMSDEVDSLISQLDHKGRIKNDYFNFSSVKVTSFEAYNVQNALEKMRELRDELLPLTQIDIVLDSKSGKAMILEAHKYMGFVSRIYRIFADVAHTQNNFNSMSFNSLSDLNLRVDKMIALELLARMNLKAKHVDADTMEIMVSEAEKQSYEYAAIANPQDITQYGKLVQFMSIRDMITNRWALQRMNGKTIDDPAINSCGQGMLSFRPSTNKKMSDAPSMKELFDFDLFYTNYVPLIPSATEVSKKHNLLNATTANALISKIIKAIPTIEYTLVEDFGWDETEIKTWATELTQTLVKNEINEWSLYAQTILSTTIFPGDDLSPDYIANRMVEDTFQIRKLAILNQLLEVFSIFPAEDLKALEKIVNKRLEELKPTWNSSYKTALLPTLNKVTNIANIRSQNRNDKIAETTEIVKATLSSAYLSEYILTNKVKKAHQHNVLPTREFEIKSPLELMTYFQAKLDGSDSGARVSKSMDFDKKYADAVQVFFKAVAEEFNKKTKKVTDPLELSQILLNISINKANELKVKHPYDAFKNQQFERHTVVADNTRVARPAYVALPVIDYNAAPAKNQNNFGQEWYDYQDPKKTYSDSTGNKASNYDVMSMMRYSPAVADNTRVVIQKQMPVVAKKKETQAVKMKYYSPYELEMIAKDVGEFYYHMFNVLNISPNYNAFTVHDKNSIRSTFFKSLADQKIIAEQRLANAYNASPLLKIPLVRSTYESEWVGGTDGMSIQKETKDEKPAMMRMLTAVKFAAGKFTVDSAKLKALILETFQVAENNSKGMISIFCGANYKNYSEDKNFKTLFRSATFVRQTITNDQGLSFEDSERLQKLDEKMKKETRYWHEAISEDYIEPMMWVAMIIFIVAAFLIPWIGAAGLMSPGTMMLVVTLLDGADLVLTGASLYFRGMSNFYEVPAQVRFQKSLASTQVSDLKLTTWDDVAQAEKENKTQQMFTLLFAPVDAIVGGQFYFSARKLMGVTGKNALKKMGVPVRSFGQPPKTVLVKRNFNVLKEQYGLYGAITRKTGDALQNAKLWLPRYQPYTRKELTEVVRVGLVTKAEEIGLAAKPWAMITDVDSMITRMDDRLNVVTTFNKETGEQIEKFTMSGKFSFKEILAKPSYTKEFLIPHTFIKAVKAGKVVEYLTNFSKTMESINALRGKFLNNKKKVLSTLREKLDEVRVISMKNPELLTKEHKNAMDYFQSLLSDEEIKMFQEITKFTKGEAKNFKSVFSDHEKVMEGIVGMKTVNGTEFSAKLLYPNALTHGTKEVFSPEFSSEAEDLKSFYESMIKHEAYGDLEDNLTILHRRDIEESLY
jgi:hypothetical protein